VIKVVYLQVLRFALSNLISITVKSKSEVSDSAGRVTLYKIL
jgi:uncharacterized membrane protein